MRKRALLIAIPLVLVFGTASTAGAQVTVSGKALTSAAQPLKHYTIRLLDSNGQEIEAALTQNDGTFSLPLVAAGTYSLEALDANQGIVSVIPITVAGAALNVSVTANPSPHLGHVAIEAAASGGFVGINGVSVLTEPITTCPAPTVGSTPACTIDPTNVLLKQNTAYSFQPALSTGVIFRYVFHPDPTTLDGMSVGLGLHVVFVPSGSSTSAAPGITFNVGTHATQVFAGLVFMPTDGFADTFPSGPVPSTFQTSSLITHDSATRRTFFIGIVIGGASIMKPGGS